MSDIRKRMKNDNIRTTTLIGIYDDVVKLERADPPCDTQVKIYFRNGTELLVFDPARKIQADKQDEGETPKQP